MADTALTFQLINYADMPATGFILALYCQGPDNNCTVLPCDPEPITYTILLSKLISSAPIYLWNYSLLIRLHADTPVNITLLLALYCYPNDPVTGTVLLLDLCCFVYS